MATHTNPTYVLKDGPMGDDYTVLVSTVNGALSVEIVLHNSEATIAPDGVMVYTVDPDGWVVDNWLPDPQCTDFITQLPEALR